MLPGKPSRTPNYRPRTARVSGAPLDDTIREIRDHAFTTRDGEQA
jgi:hypothetical protein